MTTHVRPPDLEMQVKTVSESGRTRLLYILSSPTGVVDFSHQEITGPLLQGRTEDFQAQLRRKIEQLGNRLDVDGSLLLQSDIERKLASLGHDLWRELFPPEIHHAYREIRKSVRSWMVISDEPWIPWELVKPHDDFDDDFLACRFELTRWLAGKKPPAQEIVVHHLVALRTALDLPQSKEELRLLTGLAQSSPGLEVVTSLGSVDALLGFLKDCDVDILHFTGHGLHSADRADESGVPFPDGSVLRPSDLGGSVATRVSQRRPLVFLNACWGGQQGWSWTRLGGWAARWVGVCGCGAFVAPLWPVRDKAALPFAEAFYGALLRGETLGQAALQARQTLREQRPGDPSALAYTVYGHPNAHLTLSREARSVDATPLEPSPQSSWKPRPPQGPAVLRALLRSGRAWAAIALLAGLSLVVTSLPFPVLQKEKPASAPSPAPPPGPPATVPKPKEKKQVSAPPHEEPVVSTIGGNHFEISGGSGHLKSILNQTLENAAAPLTENGISGWTVHLAISSPQTTPLEDGQTSCRLVAQGRARRQGASFSLGSVPAVNAQIDPATACDEAAKELAVTVLYQLVQSIRKGNS
jgi:hypothetical protein